MRIPDLRHSEKLESSDSSSTLESKKHSISLGRRMGRPLEVSSAGRRWFPAIGELAGDIGWIRKGELVDWRGRKFRKPPAGESYHPAG